MSKNKPTILIVDDEPSVRKLLRRGFEMESYRVLESEDSQQTITAIQSNEVDLVTLDINLNGEDGLVVAQQIRAISTVPIIMVTGKGELVDTIVGLEMGADDYIAKPFQMREVLARVKSALRRGRIDSQALLNNSGIQANHQGKTVIEQYRFADCILDTRTRDLTSADGQVYELTTAEYDMLEVLVRHALQALSRDQIMDKVRGNSDNANDRTIDNKIARLRKKLSLAGVPRAIKTVRGIGYQFTVKVVTTREDAEN